MTPHENYYGVNFLKQEKNHWTPLCLLH